MKTKLKLAAIILVTVALACAAFLGFYQCGGYVWIRQTVTAVAAGSFLLSVACSYKLSGGSVKKAVGVTTVFTAMFVIAWYSGQAFYIAPTSVSEFFGPGC